MPHLLIIGGSDAGTSAALRARELDPGLEITVVLADSYPNYSTCGLPFYLSREVADWHSLAHRRIDDITGRGISLLLDRAVTVVDPVARAVTVTGKDGRDSRHSYDRLILATGAAPVRPEIEGVHLPGVFTLRSVGDALAIHHYLDRTGATSAVLVGGGYIGCEMADAFSRRGLKVTLLERLPLLMPSLEPDFGDLVAAEMREHGVQVHTGVALRAIERQDEAVGQGEGGLLVHTAPGFTAQAGVVVLGVGARPRTALAVDAGILTGVRGAIGVTRRMETNLPGIYAAGDCVETWHRLLGRPAYLPLGSTAHKQGRVAGENAAGDERQFAGSLGTQVVKVFDLVLARTGLLQADAVAEGFDAVTTEWQGYDHKAYYPGAVSLRIRLTAERRSGRLLGAQIAGHRHAEIAKRIDVCAAAIGCGLSVRELEDMDLSYTPPLGSPWDVLQQAAQAWQAEHAVGPGDGL